jgi:hypothetical protein
MASKGLTTSIDTKSKDARLKIAQVRWVEINGGPERMLRDLAVFLDSSQFDVRFFFLKRGGPYVDELRSMGYVVEVIQAWNGYDPQMTWCTTVGEATLTLGNHRHAARI